MRTPEELVRFARVVDEATACAIDGEEALRQFKLRRDAEHKLDLALLEAKHWEATARSLHRTGRWVLGWLAFFVGVLVTQAVSEMMR